MYSPSPTDKHDVRHNKGLPVERVKVLVIDDYILVRIAFNLLLGESDKYELMGAAPNILLTDYYLSKASPDLMVLGIKELTAEHKLFVQKAQNHGTSVVVISHTEEPLKPAQFEGGGVTVVEQPEIDKRGVFIDPDYLLGKMNISRTRLPMLKANIKQLAEPGVCSRTTETAVRAIKQEANNYLLASDERVVAIGSSTGGPAALTEILTKLPAYSPGIVIVQHMPSDFTKALANRLNSICEIEVLEAKDGDMVMAGRALIAPGGKHMEVYQKNGNYHVRVFSGVPHNHCCPSVDVMFNSVAKQVGRNALGIILTGMGEDGAKGLTAMHDAGALTVAQDKASSAVYGMPRAAVQQGAADKVITLGLIFQNIIAHQSEDFYCLAC